MKHKWLLQILLISFYYSTFVTQPHFHSILSLSFFCSASIQIGCYDVHCLSSFAGWFGLGSVNECLRLNFLKIDFEVESCLEIIGDFSWKIYLPGSEVGSIGKGRSSLIASLIWRLSHPRASSGAVMVLQNCSSL